MLVAPWSLLATGDPLRQLDGVFMCERMRYVFEEGVVTLRAMFATDAGTLDPAERNGDGRHPVTIYRDVPRVNAAGHRKRMVGIR
jgi:hypothetical protein